jgi:hypothetical protein
MGGIKLLLHTGPESIGTIMAETYARHNKWPNDFSEHATKLNLGDYEEIYDAALEIAKNTEAVPMAFVISGEKHKDFRKKNLAGLNGIDDLAKYFLDILCQTSKCYKPLREGIPGTVLIAKSSHLNEYRHIYQQFADAWYEYLDTISQTGRLRRLKESGFMPVPWASADDLRRAELFTKFVVETFGSNKLSGKHLLPISCCDLIWPSQMSSEQRGEEMLEMAKLHVIAAKRKIQAVSDANKRNSDDAHHHEQQALSVINNMEKTLEILDANSIEQKDLIYLREQNAEIEWQVDAYTYDGAYNCTSCGQNCIHGNLKGTDKIIFTILIWQSLIARRSGNIELSIIDEESLCAGVLNDRYRELISCLRRRREKTEDCKEKEKSGWLKRHISSIRKALGDSVEQEKYIKTIRVRGDRQTGYCLTLIEKPDMWKGFDCKIMDVFEILTCAIDAKTKDEADLANSLIIQAESYKVPIPSGIMRYFGLDNQSIGLGNE